MTKHRSTISSCAILSLLLLTFATFAHADEPAERWEDATPVSFTLTNGITVDVHLVGAMARDGYDRTLTSVCTLVTRVTLPEGWTAQTVKRVPVVPHDGSSSGPLSRPDRYADLHRGWELVLHTPTGLMALEIDPARLLARRFIQLDVRPDCYESPALVVLASGRSEKSRVNERSNAFY